MNILFVGNSYTYYNDLPILFANLANENGKDVKTSSVTFGGAKLHQFVEEGNEYAEQLDVLIRENHYDICILQEQSILPIVDYDLFEKGAKQLVQKLSACVDKFVFYATWGRKEGSETLEQFGWTRDGMTTMLAEAYENAAKGVQGVVSYVGKNFYQCKMEDESIDLYNPDLTHPSYKGSCLAALTLYKTIFNVFPENTKSLDLTEKETCCFKKIV